MTVPQLLLVLTQGLVNLLGDDVLHAQQPLASAVEQDALREVLIDDLTVVKRFHLVAEISVLKMEAIEEQVEFGKWLWVLTRSLILLLLILALLLLILTLLLALVRLGHSRLLGSTRWLLLSGWGDGLLGKGHEAQD